MDYADPAAAPTLEDLARRVAALEKKYVLYERINTLQYGAYRREEEARVARGHTIELLRRALTGTDDTDGYENTLLDIAFGEIYHDMGKQRVALEAKTLAAATPKDE